MTRVPDARGRECDLFALKSGWVARCYRDRARDAGREARVMRYAHEHGFPVPFVRGAKGPTMLMERVEGMTMLEHIAMDPSCARGLMATLARLHDQLHEIPAPAWWPEETPAHACLLHLDLHPGNVIMAPSGPVVIDWDDVAVGAAGRDIAQTWLVLASTIVLEGLDEAVVRHFSGVLAREFAANADTRDVAHWLPSAIARRLAAGKVPAVEARELERLAADPRLWPSAYAATYPAAL